MNFLSSKSWISGVMFVVVIAGFGQVSKELEDRDLGSTRRGNFLIENSERVVDLSEADGRDPAGVRGLRLVAGPSPEWAYWGRRFFNVEYLKVKFLRNS